MIPLRQLNSIQHLRSSEVPTTQLKHLKEAMGFVRPSVNKKLLDHF